MDATDQAVVAFIQTYKKQHTYAPSMDEIGAACSLSRTAVSKRLKVLEAQGYIQNDGPRALRVLKSA